MKTIDLYEDTVGTLYLFDGAAMYSDLAATGSTFAEDAPALLAGDTDNWILDTTTEPDEVAEIMATCTRIATYTAAGGVQIAHKPWGDPEAGHAGRAYLGIERED